MGFRAGGLSLIIRLCPPIGHNDSVKAPLVPQNTGIQIITSRGPDSVYRAIGRHNRAGIALLHRNFKSLQINLSKCSLRDNRLYLTSVCLLIIGAKMLDGSGGPHHIQSPDLGSPHPAGHKRIL